MCVVYFSSKAVLPFLLLQERQRKYTQLSGPDKATLVLVSVQVDQTSLQQEGSYTVTQAHKHFMNNAKL